MIINDYVADSRRSIGIIFVLLYYDLKLVLDVFRVILYIYYIFMLYIYIYIYIIFIYMYLF